MAKKSAIARNKKREKMAAIQKPVRAELKKKLKDPNLDDDERARLEKKLQKLPRNGAACRIQTRCNVTGRPHAVYRKFGISRIAFREMALEGKLPGVTKASW